MDIRFVIVSPASQKRAVAVRLPILVGRGEEAKFRIQQDSVSRRHCELFVKDDVVYVRDLGSTNGTMLDGAEMPASEATRVSPGGIVQVGGVSFRVDYASAAAAAPEAGREGDTVPMSSGAAEPVGTIEVAAGGDQPEAAADAPAADAAPDDSRLNDFFKSLT